MNKSNHGGDGAAAEPFFFFEDVREDATSYKRMGGSRSRRNLCFAGQLSGGVGAESRELNALGHEGCTWFWTQERT